MIGLVSEASHSGGSSVGSQAPGPDQPHGCRPVTPRVLVWLGGERDEAVRLTPLVLVPAQRRKPEIGPRLVTPLDVGREHMFADPRQEAVARTPERPPCGP